MLINIGNSVIEMDKLESMIMNSVEEKKKVMKSPGFLGLFPEYETTEAVTGYKLEVKYLRGIQTWTFTNHAPDSKTLKDIMASVIFQIKGYDNDAVSVALEQAILGDQDGSGSN